MSTEPTTFGRRLRELREAAGLTRNALAARAGIDPIRVHRLEDGTRGDDRPVGYPRLDTAIALARALGVGLEVFDEPGPVPGPAKKSRKKAV